MTTSPRSSKSSARTALRQVDGVARRLILLSAEERARRRRASRRASRASSVGASRVARVARGDAERRRAWRREVPPSGTPYPHSTTDARASPPTATRAMLDGVAAAWDDAVRRDVGRRSRCRAGRRGFCSRSRSRRRSGSGSRRSIARFAVARRRERRRRARAREVGVRAGERGRC